MKKLLIIALITILIMTISWATTAGIIWLICLCFKWSFSILTSTGVWLILLLLSGCFPKRK